MQITRRRMLGGLGAALGALGFKPKTPKVERKTTMGYALTAKSATSQSSGLLQNSLITVPAGEWWDVKAIWAWFVTSAVAGNRQLGVRFDLTTTQGAILYLPVTTPASKTAELRTGGTAQNQNIVGAAVTWDTYVVEYQNRVTLAPGETVYGYDFKSVNVAGDTVTLGVSYDKYQYTAEVVQIQSVGPIAVQLQ